LLSHVAPLLEQVVVSSADPREGGSVAFLFSPQARGGRGRSVPAAGLAGAAILCGGGRCIVRIRPDLGRIWNMRGGCS
jgi:hypothetical protein